MSSDPCMELTNRDSCWVIGSITWRIATTSGKAQTNEAIVACMAVGSTPVTTINGFLM